MDDRLQDHRVSSPSAAPSAYREQPTVQRQPAYTASGRRHMGIASNDPDYLPPVDANHPQGYVPMQPAHPRSQNPDSKSLHVARYLETPTSRKSIFIRHNRTRRRAHLVLALVAIIAVVAFLIWFVLFR